MDQLKCFILGSLKPMQIDSVQAVRYAQAAEAELIKAQQKQSLRGSRKYVRMSNGSLELRMLAFSENSNWQKKGQRTSGGK
jgi:hypothetical protein